MIIISEDMENNMENTNKFNGNMKECKQVYSTVL